MAEFVAQIGLKSYLLYLQDFGGPVGFRMAVKNPAAVAGLIIQNANAYEEGIATEQLDGMRARARGLGAEGRRQVEQLVSRDFTMFMYRSGSRDFASIDPSGWNLDALLLENPDARRIQVGLMSDYFSNVTAYPQWQAFMRARPLKTLIVWGRNDPIFLPAGAQAYLRDLPGARLRFLDTGHFALEEDVRQIAREIQATFVD
jgi:pimeloyl-ACP methyl ester carboxylesterase